MILRKMDHKDLTSNMVVHRLGVKKGLFGTIQENFDSAAVSAARGSAGTFRSISLQLSRRLVLQL
jgi:hypothetical protein